MTEKVLPEGKGEAAAVAGAVACGPPSDSQPLVNSRQPGWFFRVGGRANLVKALSQQYEDVGCLFPFPPEHRPRNSLTSHSDHSFEGPPLDPTSWWFRPPLGGFSRCDLGRADGKPGGGELQGRPDGCFWEAGVLFQTECHVKIGMGCDGIG